MFKLMLVKNGVYWDTAGQLVGYDVSFAYRLAADLNVHLRFIPFTWGTLVDDLVAQKFDIAMAGIYVTEDRLIRVRISDPYLKSSLAFFLPRDRVSDFRSRTQINNRIGTRIGIIERVTRQRDKKNPSDPLGGIRPNLQISLASN